MQNTKATTVVSTQTKKIESVQVSIINTADSINEGEASNFSLELRNNSDELVGPARCLSGGQIYL